MKISNVLTLIAVLGLGIFFISGNAISDESAMNDMEKKKIDSSMMTGDADMAKPMANKVEDGMKTDMKKPMGAEMEDPMKADMEKSMEAGMESTMKKDMKKPMMSSDKS